MTPSAFSDDRVLRHSHHESAAFDLSPFAQNDDQNLERQSALAGVGAAVAKTALPAAMALFCRAVLLFGIPSAS